MRAANKWKVTHGSQRYLAWTHVFKSDKQTWQWKNQWYTEDDFSNSLKFCDVWQNFFFYGILNNEDFKMEVEQTIFVAFNNYSTIILLII